LDTLEPPTPVLRSAKEAKERLREIVEGFLLQRLRGEDGKHIRRLLVKKPPGAGQDERGDRLEGERNGLL